MDWYFRVDLSECVGCGACVFGCVFYGEDLLYMGKRLPFADDEDLMYLCRNCDGYCMHFCPNDAIEIGKD